METLLYEHLAIAQDKPVFQLRASVERKLSNTQIVEDFMNYLDPSHEGKLLNMK